MGNIIKHMEHPKITLSTGDIVIQMQMQTDFQYDPLGIRLAVADSTGHVHLFRKVNIQFVLEQTIKVADSYILSIAWNRQSHLLAVGTFNKRVIVLAEIKGVWEEVAWYDNHQGPINKVLWADRSQIKLYSISSDGCLSTLEVGPKKWQSIKVKAHNGAVTSLAIRPIPLVTIEDKDTPVEMLATAGKDSSIKIWSPNKSSDTMMGGLFEEEQEICEAFKPLIQIKAGPVKRILWRNEVNLMRSSELIYALQSGEVIHLTVELTSKKHKQTQIMNCESPVSGLEQSLTGEKVVISTESGDKWLCQVKNEQWRCQKL